MSIDADRAEQLAKNATVFGCEGRDDDDYGGITYSLSSPEVHATFDRREDFLFHREARKLVLDLAEALRTSEGKHRHTMDVMDGMQREIDESKKMRREALEIAAGIDANSLKHYGMREALRSQLIIDGMNAMGELDAFKAYRALHERAGIDSKTIDNAIHAADTAHLSARDSAEAEVLAGTSDALREFRDGLIDIEQGKAHYALVPPDVAEIVGDVMTELAKARPDDAKRVLTWLSGMVKP